MWKGTHWALEMEQELWGRSEIVSKGEASSARTSGSLQSSFLLLVEEVASPSLGSLKTWQKGENGF